MLQIVKIGSNCLFDDQGRVNYGLLDKKAQEILAMDAQSVLVVSGAIKLGKKSLGIKTPNPDLTKTRLQSIATHGQLQLMKLYESVFERLHRPVGQIEFTYDDLDKKEDIRDLIYDSLHIGLTPIINYNDSSDFNELRHDNDTLAAKVLTHTKAERLFLLGKGYDGLQDQSGTLVKHVSEVTDDMHKWCRGASEDSNGGMETKLNAAEEVLAYGAREQYQPEVIIGNIERRLDYLLMADSIRTLFKKI